MNERDLELRLSALKGAISQVDPPDAIAHALRRAISARDGRGRRAVKRLAAPWALPLAVAAAVALVALTLRSLTPADISPSTLAIAPRVATDFLPLVPAAELARSENSYVVSTRLPRARLAEFGLPVNPARAGDAVDSELLVRSDGAILAVRFIE